MTKNDILVFVFTAIVGVGAVICSIVVVAIKLQNWLNEKFVEVNEKITEEISAIKGKLYHELHERDLAIRRLEFWAVKQQNGFQPGSDPIELLRADGKRR